MTGRACHGHVNTHGPDGLNACPTCHPPRTLAGDVDALRSALGYFGRDIAAELRMVRLVAWLVIHQKKEHA